MENEASASRPYTFDRVIRLLITLAVVAAILIWLVVKHIPETKGVELEEMTYDLKQVGSE